MKKMFKVLLSCLLVFTLLFSLAACGGSAVTVDKVYQKRITGWSFDYEGQSIAQYSVNTLTLYSDGTYEYVHTMTLNLNGGTGGGYFTNVSFGTYTSEPEDPNDEENTVNIITLSDPTRVIHHDAYDWGTQLYIDTADTSTYPENEAGDTMSSFEEVLEYIRTGMPVNYIGGAGTYSMTVTVNTANGEITEVIENAPAPEAPAE